MTFAHLRVPAPALPDQDRERDRTLLAPLGTEAVDRDVEVQHPTGVRVNHCPLPPAFACAPKVARQDSG